MALEPKKARTGGMAAAAWAVAGLTLTSGLVLAGSPSVAGASHPHVIKIGTAKVAHVGTVLTTGTGLTLYYFTKDPAGQSTCTGGCAQIYPPYLAAKGAHIQGPRGVKGLSLISVGSGHWQVAFDHAALYRFEGDKKKGQAKAQGAIGLWFVALKSGIKPASVAGPASTVPTSTSTTGAPAAPTTQAPHASTTSPPAPQGGPPPTMPAPAPTTPPTTAPPPPTTTTYTPPTTTTTLPAGGGGGGVGF